MNQSKHVSLLFFNLSFAQGVVDKDELQKQRLQLKKEIEAKEKTKKGEEKEKKKN